MKQLSAYRFFPVVTKDKTILIEGLRRFSKPSQSLGHPQEETIEEKVQVTSFLIVFWHTMCLWSLRTFLPLWFLWVDCLGKKEGWGCHQLKSPRALAHKLSQPRVGCGLGEGSGVVCSKQHPLLSCPQSYHVGMCRVTRYSDLSLEVPRSWFLCKFCRALNVGFFFSNFYL